jgi:hypothetical protein
MKAAAAALVLIPALFALAAPEAAAQRQPTPRAIKCEGPFGPNATHAEVVKVFGANNVSYQDIDGAEGEKIKATVLFAGDAKARLEILWSDEQARRGPMVRARDRSTWTGPNGIHIGMTLAEIEKMNGKPFKLSGFDWDYGGRVLDWQGGSLGKPQQGGCIVGVEFVHPEDAPEENLNKVTGDNEFASDSADMRAVAPYVSVVTVSYPQR